MTLASRRLALGIVLALGLGLDTSAPAGGADAPQGDVRLEIISAVPVGRMRCLAVLAHFVTLEVGEAGPGESLAVTMRRPEGDSVLAMDSAARQGMAVENVLCGVAGDWSATRSDVPLLALRDPQRHRLEMICVLAGRLRCAASEPR